MSNTQTGGQTNNLRFFENATGATQRATFTFTPAIKNLQVTLLDIDSSGTSWNDQVANVTPGYVPAIINPTYVVGTGTTGDPFRAATNNTSANTPGSSPNGNVGLTYPATPLSTFAFTYFQGPTATGVSSAFIGLSALTFQPGACP